MISALALVVSCINKKSFSTIRDENPNKQIHPKHTYFIGGMDLFMGILISADFFCGFLGSLVQVVGLPDPPRNGQGWRCSQLRQVELVAEGQRGGLR